MSFATYLTGPADIKILTAAAIVMILKCILDDCKIPDIELHVSCNVSQLCWSVAVTVNCIGIALEKHWNYKSVATGIYNISDLELHALEQTITICQITMHLRQLVDPARPRPTRGRSSLWWIDVYIHPPKSAPFLSIFNEATIRRLHQRENRSWDPTGEICVWPPLHLRCGSEEGGVMNSIPRARMTD
jgi:hypothetical protein